MSAAKALGGGALVLFSLIYTIGGLSDPYRSGGLIALGLFCGLAGGALIRSLVRDEQKRMGTRVELPARAEAPSVRDDDVLTWVDRRDGRATAAELAVDFEVAFSAARDALERLAKSGACEGVNEGGTIVYVFRRPRKPIAKVAPPRSS